MSEAIEAAAQGPAAKDDGDKEDTYTVPDMLEFALEFRMVPVRLRDPKTGMVQDYCLRELDGNGRRAYMNAMGQSIDVDYADSQNPHVRGIKELGGTRLVLLQQCLYHAELSPDGRTVTKVLDKVNPDVVVGMPDRILEQLHKAAARISAVDKGARKREGND